MLSVNDDREPVVGRVWNHPFNRGLMIGQKIQIPIGDIYDYQYEDSKMLYNNLMYAKIMNSKHDGENMTAIFYDHDKIPIKTVHFGAESYDDYTVASHDEDKHARYIKRHQVAEKWKDCTTAGALSRYIFGPIGIQKPPLINIIHVLLNTW